MTSPDKTWPEPPKEQPKEAVACRRTRSGGGGSAPRRDERKAAELPEEVSGPKGPEPTRYGDWEQKG